MNEMSGDAETLYFHGQPGSPSETYFLPEDARDSITFAESAGAADAAMASLDGNASVRLVGFSIGAMAAIRTAARHRDRVSRLILISPAAPLELGDFLPRMAGRRVFESARGSGALFGLITEAQRLGAAALPSRTIDLLFGAGPESEIELASDPDFRAALLHGLTYSYGGNKSAYKAAVRDYVRPWGRYLSDVACPVTVRHGGADNWSPPDMAHAIRKRISTTVDFEIYPRLGHFTTLHRALPRLFERRASGRPDESRGQAPS